MRTCSNYMYVLGRSQLCVCVRSREVAVAVKLEKSSEPNKGLIGCCDAAAALTGRGLIASAFIALWGQDSRCENFRRGPS